MWRTLAGLRAFSGRSASRASFTRFYSSEPTQKMGTMKRLAKEYGWSATGVYVALSLIDLPLSFVLVHNAGQERMEDGELAIRRLIGADTEREHTYIHRAAKGGKNLYLAEFGIAYIIHKALLVVRIPLTVAITPAVARKLAEWGFNVTRAMPSVDKNKLAAQVASKTAGYNSEAVKRAANMITRNSKSGSANVAKGANRNGKVGDSINASATAGKDSGSPAKDFGQPPSQKRRWWWFF